MTDKEPCQVEFRDAAAMVRGDACPSRTPPDAANVPKAGAGTSHQTLDEQALLDETPMAGYRDVEDAH